MRTPADPIRFAGSGSPSVPAFWPALEPPRNASPALLAAMPVQAAGMPNAESLAPAGDVSHRFGVKLRKLRFERRMTQQDMARRFGIDRSFISDVERGRKSISLVSLEILALGLGVSISELLADV